MENKNEKINDIENKISTETMDDSSDIMIKMSGVKKRYRLCQIGGGTLQADLQSWWARVRGKEDPNTKIGENQSINARGWYRF